VEGAQLQSTSAAPTPHGERDIDGEWDGVAAGLAALRAQPHGCTKSSAVADVPSSAAPSSAPADPR
jgi:hypothetical protein